LPPGALDQNAAHGLGGGGEKVAPAVPDRLLPAFDQAQPGFMHQRRRLKCLSRANVSHLGCREAAQLLVDQREQFVSSGGISIGHGFENLRDAAHGKDDSGAFIVGNTVSDISIFVIPIPAPVLIG
jgi:hypothetical protein